MLKENYPLVTVIIPSYNHAQYIETAIQSVYSQDYPNIELIVNDDGSTDGTHAVLAKYQEFKNTIIVLNEKNRGQSAVFNESIDLSSGEYICVLPSDDWYLPRKTSLQVEKFKAASAEVGVVYGGGLRYFEDTKETVAVDLKKYRGNILRELLTEPFFVYPITPMFKRECFEKVRFDEKYRAEGEALYVKVAMYYEFDFVEEHIAVMRDHSYNIGKDTNLMFSENIRYWTEFFNNNMLPDNIMKLRSIRLGRLYRSKGLDMIRKKSCDSSLGRKLLYKALMTRKMYLLDYKIFGGIVLSFFK